MAIEDRALGYVVRANDALGDLDGAEQLWADTVRSTSDEMLLHRLPIALDNAIRKVEGSFEFWETLDPAQLESVATHGPVKLFQLLSSHPNGRVREAFVQLATDRPDDHVLPHLANRAVEFVPSIRELASLEVRKRLTHTISLRPNAASHGVLPTSTHIAVTKLLAPRTAVVDPALLLDCIEVARTTTTSRPGRLSDHGLERMRERCEQTAVAVPDAAPTISELVDFFEETAAA